MQITLRKQAECDHNSEEKSGKKMGQTVSSGYLRVVGFWVMFYILFIVFQSFQKYLHIVCATSLSRCPALCDPMNHCPPCSSIRDFPGEDAGVGYNALLIYTLICMNTCN